MPTETKKAPPPSQGETSPVGTVLLLTTWILGMVAALAVFGFVCYLLIQ